MSDKKRHLPVNLDSELSAKFQYICKRNASSANSMLVRYIMKVVKSYETEFGKIGLDDLQQLKKKDQD